MRGAFDIGDATQDDLPAIASLERNEPFAAHWSSKTYDSLLDDSVRRHVLTAKRDGVVIGFLAASCAGEEWEIENIVVSQDHRRQGVGASLLEALITKASAAGATNIFLEVRGSNRVALDFYRTAGFEERGTRRGYYSQPVEDAVVYVIRVG